MNIRGIRKYNDKLLRTGLKEEGTKIKANIINGQINILESESTDFLFIISIKKELLLIKNFANKSEIILFCHEIHFPEQSGFDLKMSNF